MENHPPFAAGSPNADLPCPRCGVINPPYSLQCNCGYQFHPGAAVPGQSWSQTAEATEVSVPKLHWGALIVLSLFTCGIFMLIWAFRQGLWARQAEPKNNALVYYSISIVAIVLEVGFSFSEDFRGMEALFSLTGNICFLLGNFSVKSAIESYLDKSMSGLLTFFFGPIYNQYKLNEGRTASLNIT